MAEAAGFPPLKGHSYEGINVIGIRWGKVRQIRIYTDTERLVTALARLAAAGNPDASAAPILA